MDEDIPLPVYLPAAALKKAHSRVSWFQGVNDCFYSAGVTGQANPQRQLATRPRRAYLALARSVKGHFEPFPRPRLNGRCRFS
jgi:hypothetical protein